MSGKTIDEVGDRYDGDVLGDDPSAAYDASARVAGDAFARPGAMEAPVAVSYGPVPGEIYAGHRFIDVLIHGWDLAVATGQDSTLDSGTRRDVLGDRPTATGPAQRERRVRDRGRGSGRR